MTKIEAKKIKYCEHCAAFYAGRQHCGIVGRLATRHLCGLDDETIIRWKKEYNLESFTKKKGELNHVHSR